MVRADHVFRLVPPASALIVHHFGVGNENALPPRGGKLLSQRRVLEEHEVRLVEPADGVKCLASKQQARSGKPVDNVGPRGVGVLAVGSRERVVRPNPDQKRMPDAGNESRELAGGGVDGSRAVTHERPEGSPSRPRGRGRDQLVDGVGKKDDVGVDDDDPLGIPQIKQTLATGRPLRIKWPPAKRPRGGVGRSSAGASKEP